MADENITVTDSLGGLDDLSRSLARTLGSELLGGSDSLSRSLARTLTAESLGGLDSRTAAKVVTITDVCGGVDSVTSSADWARTINDRISVTDPGSLNNDIVDLVVDRPAFRAQGGHPPTRPVVVPRRRYFSTRSS